MLDKSILKSLIVKCELATPDGDGRIAHDVRIAKLADEIYKLGQDEAYQAGGRDMIELLEDGYFEDFSAKGIAASIKYQLSLPYENKIATRPSNE